MSRPNDAPGGPNELGLPAEAGSVYELALTHRSYAFEQPDPPEHNERLEFLGDAVLQLIVTDWIYRHHPELPEGGMNTLRASVVNTYALADVARDLNIGQHLLLGKGEESSGGRDKASLLENTFEALVGAAYLDKGFDPVRDYLVTLFAPLMEEVLSAGGGVDPKSTLQEVVVKKSGARPVYELTARGPDHDKKFTAQVFINGRLRGEGEGRSKKEAEQAAAREALDQLDGEEALDARAG